MRPGVLFDEDGIVICNGDDGVTTYCADLEKLDADLAEIDRQSQERRAKLKSLLIKR